MVEKSLRKALTMQPVVSLFLSVAFIALFGFFWVHPQIRSEVESRQSGLARAAVSQLETFIETSMAIVRGSALTSIDVGPTLPHSQDLLDAQLLASSTLNSIVVTDYNGQTVAAGVLRGKEIYRKDLLNLDISRTPLFKQVIEKKEPQWSETFLSVITGRISVAYAVPGEQVIAIGEVDLEILSSFLNQIVEEGDLVVMIIDNKGQVITDNNNQYTGQQFNVANISLVQKAIHGGLSSTESFEFQKQKMVGSVRQVPFINWTVLVAQPLSSMYQSILTTTWIVIGGLLAALLSGVILSIVMAGKLSTAFDNLNALASDIAIGKQPAALPKTPISEFNLLAENLQHMSAVLLLRESELTESEGQLRLILDSTGEAIYGINKKGECIFYNTACLEMLGYDQQQNLHGKKMHDLIHHTKKDGTPYPIGECTICKSFKRHESSHIADELLWRADGTSFPVEFKSYPQMEKGQLIGAVMTFIDITGRNRLEEQLRQSQKMESIGRLAGGVAHDFNNMLSIILGYAEISMMDVPESDKLWRNLNQISKAAERSRDITRQLLAFSRKEIIAPKPVNLNANIIDTEKNLGRLIGEDIEFSFRPSTGLWTVKIDPSQLDQIFMNLLVNARDAMPNGGLLTVETANTQINESYSHFHLDAKSGDYVQLTVSDSGCGMDRETREHIFEPFFTTKGSGEGTGLGLATVYGIVTQNNGFISVYSEPDQGTVFKIFLPRLLEESTPDEQPPASRELAGTGTILLVEDEEMLLLMTTELLDKIGYTVICAPTPLEAISICKNVDQQIDMILTDVVMPEMNGLEMVNTINTIRPDIKVLFMSGYTADIVAKRGIIEAGVNFIPKPLELAKLHEKIMQVMGEI